MRACSRLMEGRCISKAGAGGLIDNALQRLTEWIPADPVNFMIGLGAGAMAFAYFVFVDLYAQDLKRRLEAPGPAPEVAIHYSYATGSSGRNLLAVIVLIAFWLFEMWDRRNGAFDLEKLAIVGAPTLLFLILHERRRFRTRPAVAVHADGLLLDSWRGETMVPWEDVAYIETDPAESTGYRPNTHLRLVIGHANGRNWRYSEGDFGDDASSQFEMIIGQARRHIG